MEKMFLEITDLPTDTDNVFSGLRQPLIATFNNCREFPYKMAAFKALIKFIYNAVVSYEKATAPEVVTAVVETKPE